MKSFHALLAVSVVGITVFVSGCGVTHTQQPLTTTNVTAATNTVPSTPSTQTVWIEYARYTAYQEHQGPTYWVLTNKRVYQVGQQEGAIDPSPLNGSGWHSNMLSVGTKFFVIPGTSPTKAFAVQMKNGVYLEAVSVGSKKPTPPKITPSDVAIHSYASATQAVAAINAIQQQFGEIHPSGPNLNLGNGISAQEAGSLGSLYLTWTEDYWTILIYEASNDAISQAKQMVAYLHTHMLPAPQNKGVIAVAQSSNPSTGIKQTNTTIAWQVGTKVYEVQQTGNPINSLQAAVNHG
jgi:hypothetical protein